MKRCPECRKDYFDDSLLYCLDDGTPLVQGTVVDEPATAILSGNSVASESPTQTLKADDTATQKTKDTSRFPKFFSRERLPWIAAAGFALIAFGLSFAYLNRGSGAAEVVRLSFEPPAELSFNDVQPDTAVISPDGRRVAFSANGADGKNMLYVRELNAFEAKLLPGSDNPLEPFWSPDSKSVAYGSNGKLMRSDLSGGNAQVLCDAARMVGGSWSHGGTIIFVPDYRTTVVQVSAQGGEPKPVAMNTDKGDAERHRYPYFLPDGRHFLFQRETKGIWAGSIDSPEVVQILSDNSAVVYSRQGWLILSATKRWLHRLSTQINSLSAANRQ